MNPRYPSIELLAERARQRMPGFAYDYLAGGCMAEVNLRKNTSDIRAVELRPTIDGRLGGVRESLENQTLALAKAAARLITSFLRHRDGSPVECVVPPQCIGGAAEASATDALFARSNVGLTLTVTPCRLHPRPSPQPSGLVLGQHLSADPARALQRGNPSAGPRKRELRILGHLHQPLSGRDQQRGPPVHSRPPTLRRRKNFHLLPLNGNLPPARFGLGAGQNFPGGADAVGWDSNPLLP